MKTTRIRKVRRRTPTKRGPVKKMKKALPLTQAQRTPKEEAAWQEKLKKIVDKIVDEHADVLKRLADR